VLDIRLNGQSLRDILTTPPKISDQASGICRVLEFEVVYSDKLVNFLGQPVELWYNEERWFFGFVLRRGKTSDRKVTFKAYDPLFYFKRTQDDHYVKNKTATQGFTYLAHQVGVKVHKLADTKAVFSALYYPNKTPDKIAVDLLARTFKASGRKYWFRYNPGVVDEGLYLFERTVPEKIWSFTVGVNLSSASMEESVEQICPVIKLVNRETGKTVYAVDNPALQQYGHQIHFEEVGKDKADTMETYARELLKKLCKVDTLMSIDGTNPDRVMPQFFSGDVIYVEEELTGIIGGFYIRNVTQTFNSDNLVTISADITEAPDVPEIEYEDADKDPNAKKRKGKKANKKADTGTGLQEKKEYNEQIKKQIEKYGLLKGEK
jgi:hypothetical protein